MLRDESGCLNHTEQVPGKSLWRVRRRPESADEYDEHDPNDVDVPEEEAVDDYAERAKDEILDTLLQQRLVTDREIKVRLEKSFFPWVVDRAMKALQEDGKVRRVGDPGRKLKGAPELFYTLGDIELASVSGIMAVKKRVSFEVNSLLTKLSPGGRHAEDLFDEAFRTLGFEILGRDVSAYKGRVSRGVEGKQRKNLDFVLRRDGVEYGADVKNWIRYEYVTRADVEAKVRVAKDLGLVPLIIARYVDKDALYTEVIRKGGVCYPFKTLLISSTYESLAAKAGALLGYPIIPVDVLPRHKRARIEKLHHIVLERKNS